MEGPFSILIIICFLYLIVWTIKLAIRSATHTPTWKGIIISAFLGMLPAYLILCFFGIMGEKRNELQNGPQPYTGTYAEEMSRRYGYNNTPKKKRSWFTFIMLAFVVICLFYLTLPHRSEKQEGTINEKQESTDNALPDNTLEEIHTIVKPPPNQSTKKLIERIPT